MLTSWRTRSTQERGAFAISSALRLRQRLLLTLVRDDRLNTDDLRGLMALLGRTFAPRRVATRLGERLLNRLNPLAA